MFSKTLLEGFFENAFARYLFFSAEAFNYVVKREMILN